MQNMGFSVGHYVVVISGKTGDDVKQYQEKAIKKAINGVNK